MTDTLRRKIAEETSNRAHYAYCNCSNECGDVEMLAAAILSALEQYERERTTCPTVGSSDEPLNICQYHGSSNQREPCTLCFGGKVPEKP